MFIVDAHLDLAYSALSFDRDLRQSVAILRGREPLKGHPVGGQVTVAVPDLIEAGVGLVWSTLYSTPHTVVSRQLGERLIYRNGEEAHRLAQKQLDYYHRLADEDSRVRLVTDGQGLNDVLSSHGVTAGPVASEEKLLGLFILMEGADPVRAPEEIPMWHERGVRAIGPAWHTTRYAPGAGYDDGAPLPAEGVALLEMMAEWGMILDISHMGERAALTALEIYGGQVVATHSNARKLLGGSRRHLADEQIRLLAERGGVMGVVLYNKFLKVGYRLGDGKHMVGVAEVVAQIDYVCQLLGTAEHVAIGTDFDGGFGALDIPAEVDGPVDLIKIGAGLQARGYDEGDIGLIMGGNWVRVLQKCLGS
ncbi:MAG TPA: membrane dipeptidase [Anaerolineae bacterium]|nr:membrane dipeptidase [Anaerolineae bacterium]